MSSAVLFCLPSAEMPEYLLKTYNEATVAHGVTLEGALVRFYASPEGDSWTMTVTTPQGNACIVNAGQGWTQ